MSRKDIPAHTEITCDRCGKKIEPFAETMTASLVGAAKVAKANAIIRDYCAACEPTVTREVLAVLDRRQGEANKPATTIELRTWEDEFEEWASGGDWVLIEPRAAAKFAWLEASRRRRAEGVKP
jgi:hypothetical protein